MNRHLFKNNKKKNMKQNLKTEQASLDLEVNVAPIPVNKVSEIQKKLIKDLYVSVYGEPFDRSDVQSIIEQRVKIGIADALAKMEQKPNIEENEFRGIHPKTIAFLKGVREHFGLKEISRTDKWLSNYVYESRVANLSAAIKTATDRGLIIQTTRGDLQKKLIISFRFTK
jgi:hypothetical protein